MAEPSKAAISCMPESGSPLLQQRQRLTRPHLRRPVSKLTRALRVKWPGLAFEQYRIGRQGKHRVPSPGGHVHHGANAWTGVALCAEFELLDNLACFVKHQHPQQALHCHQSFVFGHQVMPMGAHIAVQAEGDEQPLERRFMAGVNVLGLPQPG